MSFLASKEKPCTHCQFPNEVEIWSVVNVQEDPELKDLLLGGELNMAICSSCQKVFFAEDFLLYHDPSSELLAFVYPYDLRDEKEKYEQKTKDDFSASQKNSLEASIDYEPLTLFGFDELLALVEWDEEAKIQSEIVGLMSKEQGFQMRRLPIKFSRLHKIPPLLPILGGNEKNERAPLLAALSEINRLNDRLSLYREAESRLSSELDLKIPFVSPEGN